ncbi:MerR family transcriptional regulator [Streptomyces sp. NPDC028722]|uniref:MerR family transcriptional regulator n=1 Tax=Streptomyces sp. NPDC028722 TaxID=3155016 RepID=UPI0033F241A4
MGDVEESLSIGEMAARTGVSVHTLRYYERVGLLTGVPRTAGGRRVYGTKQLASIKFISRLRETGMPIAQVLTYAELVRADDDTRQRRLEILIDHHQSVLMAINEQRRHLDAIQAKIDLYREALRTDG